MCASETAEQKSNKACNRQHKNEQHDAAGERSYAIALALIQVQRPVGAAEGEASVRRVSELHPHDGANGSVEGARYRLEGFASDKIPYANLSVVV